MTALRAFRFVAQIQTLVSVSRKLLPYFADAKLILLAGESLPQPLHAKYGMLSLSSFAASTVLGSIRSEKQGRARRSAAACASATLSQRWRSYTHSNMRMVELCRNFSSGHSRFATQKEKYALGSRNHRAEGE